MAIRSGAHDGPIEIRHERGGDRVERRRHRRGEDRRHHQAGQAGGEVAGDEIGEDLIRCAERCGWRPGGVAGKAIGTIEREEHHSDEEKSDELGQHHDAGREESDGRAARTVRAQISLHQELIRAVRAHGQEAPADQPGPEGERARCAQGEIEEVKLSVRPSQIDRRVDSAGRFPGQDDRRSQRAADVDPQLHHLHPHHRLHPAVEREDDHHQADADDAGGDHRLRRRAAHASVNRGQDERGEQQAHAVGDRAHGDEERRSQRSHSAAEAALQQLVHGDDRSAEVERDEEDGDHHPAEEIAEHELQEGEVAAAREKDARNGDKGDGRSLRGHDRRADGPPRHVTAGEEVSGGGLLPLPEPRAGADDRREVGHDDHQIDDVQSAEILVPRA